MSLRENYIPNNKTTNTGFLSLCKLTQPQLKKKLKKELGKYFRLVADEDGFLYAKGDIPVLLTAHLDTVHKEPVREWHEKKGKIKSPQGIGGDDRCGVYIILQILKAGYRPSILFCEDEESGGKGSTKFTRTDYIEEFRDIKFIVGLDRRGKNDAVYYDCGNKMFKEFILNQTGYVENFGSFTDICNLSDATDIASVNLSCGYYNEHSKDEYVNLKEMYGTCNTVKKLLDYDFADIEQFKYEPEISYGRGIFSDWCLDGDECFKVGYSDENGYLVTETVMAISYEEAVGVFLMSHPTLTFDHIINIDYV